MRRIVAFALLAVLMLTGCTPITFLNNNTQQVPLPTQEPQETATVVDCKQPASPVELSPESYMGEIGLVMDVWVTCFDNSSAQAEIDVTEQQIADYVNQHGVNVVSLPCDAYGSYLFIPTEDVPAIIGEDLYGAVLDVLDASGVSADSTFWLIGYFDPTGKFPCEAIVGQEA